MGVNYGEFKLFVDNFKKMQSGYSSFLNDFLLKCAMDTLARTKKRTPIDTGDLRRNWYITGVIRKSNSEIVVYLYNTKDYATYVELGHQTRDRTGWIEGYYMATISMEEVNSKLPRRFEREFTKFLKNMEVY